MKVTLISIDPGSYRVRRGTEEWAGQVTVLATFNTWEVWWHPGNREVLGKVVGEFRMLRDARAWLDSTDGQVWLDFRPRRP